MQIIKNWTGYWMSDADFLAQTPGGRGIWGDVQFYLEPIERPDYVIVFNRPTGNTVVECDPQNVWGLIQEPPNELYRSMHRGQAAFGKVLMADPENRGARYQLSHPAVPWFVGRSYDEVAAAEMPAKNGRICCITSATTLFAGHERRLRFLEEARAVVDIDVYGKGIRYIPNKWDVLSTYRYALVLENSVHPWYWSEKVSDCFLCWTLPIYLGCPRIGEYFPDDAVIQIGGMDTAAAIERIRTAIEKREWKTRLDALKAAREQALNHYNTFAYLAELVSADRASARPGTPRAVKIRAVTFPLLVAWTRAKVRALWVNNRRSSRQPANLLDRLDTQ